MARSATSWTRSVPRPAGSSTCRAPRARGRALARVAAAAAIVVVGGVVAGGVVAAAGEREVGAVTADPDAGDRFEDRVARLERGELPLDRSARGYLDALLGALDVDPGSQVLVFSKTSLQARRIHPGTPRAVFFGDRAYVGYIPGAPLLEVSLVRRDGSPDFFTVGQGEDPPVLRRERMCVQCHESRLTLDVEGHLVRSVHADADGFPIQRANTYLSTDRSPVEERWGGWYVTGPIDGEHMGNRVAQDDGSRVTLAPPAPPRLSDLADRIDVSRYPRPTSDVVALLVLEHQTRMHNRIHAAGVEARAALRRDRELAAAAAGGRGDAGSSGHAGSSDAALLTASTDARLRRVAEDLLRELLFAGAARLPSGLVGDPAFVGPFEARGRRDPEGRSLRDLSLRRRLFRYPCSYLIHSPGFDGLPPPLLERVYARLLEILTADTPEEEYSHLTPNARRAVLEILVATKAGLPPGFAAAR